MRSRPTTRRLLPAACLVAAAVLGVPALAHAQHASEGAQLLAPVAVTADLAPRDPALASVPLAVLDVQSPFRAPVVVAAGSVRADAVTPVCATTPCRVQLPPGRYFVGARMPDGRLAGGRVVVEMPGTRVRLRGPHSVAPGIALVLGGAALIVAGALLVGLNVNATCATTPPGGACGQTGVLLGYAAIGHGVGGLVAGPVYIGVMGRGAIAWRERLQLAAAPLVLPGAFGAIAVARF